MAKQPLNGVLEQLRIVAAVQTYRELSDGDLLERFVGAREEAAFTVLIERHGSMVLGVCRRALPNFHDAEDACQATFLVLARKASSVRKKTSLSSWLHGVACRVAVRLKRDHARRTNREKGFEVSTPRDPQADVSWREVQAILDEELERLPERYRAPLILCYLECLTRDEAAKQLGLSPTTLYGRLERARDLLRARLTRRGLTLGAAVSAVAFGEGMAQAALAATFVVSSTKVALLPASGNPIAHSVVATLAEGVIQAMFMTKLKSVVAVILLLGVVALGGGLLAYAHPVAQTDRDEQPEAWSPANMANSPDAKDTNPTGRQTQAREADGNPKEEAGKPLRSLPGGKDRLVSVAYSPDGTLIAASFWDGPDGRSGTARIWDAKTGKEVRRLEYPAGKGYSTFQQIAFTPDNAFLVTSVRESSDASVVIVWDRRTGEKVRSFRAEAGSVALSPDGRLIACGGYRIISVYEFASGKLVHEMRDEDEKQLRMDTVAFSPDGKSLVSTGHPPTPQRGDGVRRLTIMPDVARVWNVATGKERLSPLNGLVVGRHGQRVALSPDGRTFVNPSGHDITLREAATGEERAKLTGHKDEVCDYAFLPDGRTLASGSMDGTVRLWDLPSGKEIGRFGNEVPPFAGRGWVLALAFSPDGRSLVAGGLDKTADIWDVSRITERPWQTAERSPEELEQDWKDLAGDAAKGYAALSRLVSSPHQAVPFLGKQLQAVKSLDRKQIEQWIADLDADQFQVREQAAKELEALGEESVPLLRKVLAGNISTEVRRRMEVLLGRLEAASPSMTTVRQIRSVEVLEFLGTPEARRLLDKLAAGPAELRLTSEAKASAGRLAIRPTAAPVP